MLGNLDIWTCIIQYLDLHSLNNLWKARDKLLTDAIMVSIKSWVGSDQMLLHEIVVVNYPFLASGLRQRFANLLVKDSRFSCVVLNDSVFITIDTTHQRKLQIKNLQAEMISEQNYLISENILFKDGLWLLYEDNKLIRSEFYHCFTLFNYPIYIMSNDYLEFFTQDVLNFIDTVVINPLVENNFVFQNFFMKYHRLSCIANKDSFVRKVFWKDGTLMIGTIPTGDEIVRSEAYNDCLLEQFYQESFFWTCYTFVL